MTLSSLSIPVPVASVASMKLSLLFDDSAPPSA